MKENPLMSPSLDPRMRNRCKKCVEKDFKKKFKCPDCHAPLSFAGKIRPAVSHGKSKMLSVFYCRVCGWRGI